MTEGRENMKGPGTCSIYLIILPFLIFLTSTSTSASCTDDLAGAIENKQFGTFLNEVPRLRADSIPPPRYPREAMVVRDLEYGVSGESFRVSLELSVPPPSESFELSLSKKTLRSIDSETAPLNTSYPVYSLYSSGDISLVTQDGRHQPYSVRLIDEDPRTVGIEDAHLKLKWYFPDGAPEGNLGLFAEPRFSPVTTRLIHPFKFHHGDYKQWVTSAWVDRKKHIEQETGTDMVLEFEFPEEGDKDFERFQQLVEWDLYPPTLDREHFTFEWRRVDEYRSRLFVKHRYGLRLPNRAQLLVSIPFFDRPKWGARLCYRLPTVEELLTAAR